MNQRIRIGGIGIAVTFKAIKNLHLSVHPPAGDVTISAPIHMSVDTVRVYAATKLAWIKKERMKIRSQQREGEKLYIPRESHFVFGKRYLLKVTEASRPSVKLHHSMLELAVPTHYDEHQRQLLLYRYYRERLRDCLAPLVKHHAEKMGVATPAFGIRQMDTKWGSCSVDRRFLWFNIELAKKPLECVEYIVVHELAHLIERNHTAKFFAILDAVMPSWQLYKQRLNELPV